MHYTYVLECSSNPRRADQLYVGSTNDLVKRLQAHRSGEVNTTKHFTKIKLIYYEACLNKSDARKREMQLKTGFGRDYIKRRLKNYFDTRD